MYTLVAKRHWFVEAIPHMLGHDMIIFLTILLSDFLFTSTHFLINYNMIFCFLFYIISVHFTLINAKQRLNRFFFVWFVYSIDMQ